VEIEFPREGEIAMFKLFENGNDCSELRRIGRDTHPWLKPEGTLTVPANKRIALQLVFLEIFGYGICSVTTSFSLPAGKRYRINVWVDSERCHMNLLRVENGVPLPAPEVNAQKMQPVFSFSENHSCEPDPEWLREQRDVTPNITMESDT
jgi:hypothetical protein